MAFFAGFMLGLFAMMAFIGFKFNCECECPPAGCDDCNPYKACDDCPDKVDFGE